MQTKTIASIAHDNKKPEIIACAKASYNSIYGLVESGWKRKDGKIICTMKVPSNTTAKIIFPDGEHIAQARIYEYSI